MNKVVTICGSMKFKEKMMEVTKVIEYAKKLGNEIIYLEPFN